MTNELSGHGDIDQCPLRCGQDKRRYLHWDQSGDTDTRLITLITPAVEMEYLPTHIQLMIREKHAFYKITYVSHYIGVTDVIVSLYSMHYSYIHVYGYSWFWLNTIVTCSLHKQVYKSFCSVYIL